MFKQLWTHFPTLKWTSKANLVMLFFPPLQFFFFAMTYNPFVSLLPHLVFFLNPCLREWFVVLPLLDPWFYTISTLLLKVSFCFRHFSPPSFLSIMFYSSVTSVSGVKRRENKLLDFVGSSDYLQNCHWIILCYLLSDY